MPNPSVFDQKSFDPDYVEIVYRPNKSFAARIDSQGRIVQKEILVADLPAGWEKTPIKDLAAMLTTAIQTEEQRTI